jgi:hypothetical protein
MLPFQRQPIAAALTLMLLNGAIPAEVFARPRFSWRQVSVWWDFWEGFYPGYYGGYYRGCYGYGSCYLTVYGTTYCY